MTTYTARLAARVLELEAEHEHGAGTIQRLQAERDFAIADAASIRKWREKVWKAAEEVFGKHSLRYKLCLRKNGTASNVFPPELDGAWVAFQRAEDDAHIGLVAQLLQKTQELAASQYREDKLREALTNIEQEYSIAMQQRHLEFLRPDGRFGILVGEDELAVEWQALNGRLEVLIDARRKALALPTDDRKDGVK